MKLALLSILAFAAIAQEQQQEDPIVDVQVEVDPPAEGEQAPEEQPQEEQPAPEEEQPQEEQQSGGQGEVADAVANGNPEQAGDEAAQEISDATGVEKDAITGALDDPELSTLLVLFQFFDAGKLEGAEQATIFAPSNEAFDTFLGENPEATLGDVGLVLSYHASDEYVNPDDLQEGDSAKFETLLEQDGQEENYVVVVSKTADGVMVNDAKVTRTEVADEGKLIVHYIDSVLQIPQDKAEDALEDEELTELATALEEAGLLETINNAEKITIFAPNNEAFEQAGEIPEDQLESTLQYHVIEGEVVFSSDLEENNSFTSLEGGNLEVSVAEDGTVTVNGATVVKADVQTSNGVVHVIDQVLDPEQAPEPGSGSAASSGSLVQGSAALAALVTALMA